MKCFYCFKSRSKEQRSASELTDERGCDCWEALREIKCCGLNNAPQGIPESYEEIAHNLRVFTFQEMMQATNDFCEEFKIGEGGFGNVYKGAIQPADDPDGDQIVVAIKKLNTEGLQGHKQWISEVQYLSVVQHPNLVKLIGYCAVDDRKSGIQRLLVYEYMQNQSLDYHLFNRDPTIPWDKRLQVILGAAEGLAYLHEGLKTQVIYRDFKCANVLLDDNFAPKISDFGLAREGPMYGNTHVLTAVMGTYGYAAPDYIETGHLTTSSDVYSFGVVVYEILTGRRCIDRSQPRDDMRHLDWIIQFPRDSESFSLMMDPRLGSDYSLNAANRMAKLADTCVLLNPKKRPAMSQVVETLKQIIQDAEEEANQTAESPESSEYDQEIDARENEKQLGESESMKSRTFILEKLGENVDKRFIVLQQPSDT